MNTLPQIDRYIAGYTGWRGERLAQLRNLIHENGPELREEWKWNCPVWTKNGPVCAVSAFKNHVKINFFKGVLLEDTGGLFNSGLDSKHHRSINISEADELNEPALSAIIRQAVTLP